jgi:S-adenosylmethionine synthetase
VDWLFFCCRMEIEITREAQLVERSIKDAQAYESQRQELQDKHHELRQDLRKKQHADVIALEMRLQAEMKELMTTFQIKLQHPE